MLVKRLLLVRDEQVQFRFLTGEVRIHCLGSHIPRYRLSLLLGVKFSLTTLEPALYKDERHLRQVASIPPDFAPESTFLHLPERIVWHARSSSNCNPICSVSTGPICPQKVTSWRDMPACCGSATTSMANGLLILNDST